MQINPFKPSAWCQMVTLQSVQDYTDVTHHFYFSVIRALWRSEMSASMPESQKLKNV